MENEKTNTIGALLRKGREAKNLSLEEVATKTKINLNILRYLESDDLESLPNKTYVRGFVKNYAKIVSVAQEEAAAVLDQTYSSVFPESEVKEVSAEEIESKKKEENSEVQEKVISIVHSLVSKKALISVAVLIVGFFVLKGLFAFISQLSSEQITITKKMDPSTTKGNIETVVKEDDNTIKPAKDDLFEMKAAKKLKEELAAKEKEIALKEQAILEQEKEAKRLALEKKKTEEQAQAKKLEDKKKQAAQTASLNGKYPFKKFYPAPSKMYDVLENAPENNEESLLPSRFRRSVEEGLQNVYVHSTDGDTWISYQADDGPIKRFVLKQGRSVLIKGEVILLFMGNLNVAKIFLNNKLIKAQSKTGVKSIIFPQEFAKDYQLPLFPSYKGVPMKASLYKENMAEENPTEE